MHLGKNRWTVGYSAHENEQWKTRIDVNQDQRVLTSHEMRTLGVETAYLNYYTVDFIFGIYKYDGQCISGDLKYPDGRVKSRDYMYSLIEMYKNSEYPQLAPEVIDRFLYLKKIEELTRNKALKPEEFLVFKKMFHALVRDDIELVLKYLKGFNPKVSLR